MRKGLIFLGVVSLVGCGAAAPVAPPVTPEAKAMPVATTSEVRVTNGTWVGASAEGDVLATGTRDTFLGVWVDTPDARPAKRPPMEVALVVDTSGSMAGAKIENARNAARMLIRRLHDGDIVALDSFSDHATTLVPPTTLDANSRANILAQIDKLTPSGATNIFEGLSLGEGQVRAAPATHPLRRVVFISDGNATVGPSSPEILGAIAERGLAFRAQVTSLGVGTDYDEKTLDALAIRSSGRLFHIGDPSELASILDGELKTLDATIASDAQLEVVPAPGVAILGADGVRSEWHEGTLRLPLGALSAGQHREALVRVRITDPALFEGSTHALASVRLRFKDAQENDLERMQETVARTTFSSDGNAVAKTANNRTKAIVALQDAAKTQLAAVTAVNANNFGDADKELAKAEQTLNAQAALTTTPVEKKRLEAAAGRVADARKGASKAAMSPPSPAAARSQALEINANAMHDSGF